MGKFQPLPIVGGCYADDARPYSAQDCVNYLPVKAEVSGTRSEGKLTPVPGLVPFCGTQAAPVRGAHNCEGRYFVVAGTTLYQISTAGARTAIGTVPGTGRVSFDHNQITGGNEVVVVNGTQGFVYNTKTLVFAQITDQDFPGTAIIRYLGQYLLGIKPDRTNWFTSDLATATTYLSTDTYEAESAPDLLLDIQVSQGRALIMGERTIEEWVNDPTENAAFQRGSVIERGAASAFANVIMDNSLIWLGDDGIVYRLNGYTPTRISTFPIEQALAGCDLTRAFAFAWEDRGHKVYYLTCPDGHTWGYDIAAGVWHRRASYRLDRWIANTMTKWNGGWYAGHYDSGVIYRLDWTVMREGCNELVRERTLAGISDNENRVIVDAIALTLDVGTEPSITTHGPPTITGNLPDATAGDAISYQYTLTGSYPGEAVSAAITAGALPGGLTMSSAGLVTGNADAGSATWTITATGECDDTATLADAATVAGLAWAATTTPSFTALQLSPDSADWTTQARQDSIIAGRLLYSGTRLISFLGNGGSDLGYSDDQGATWTRAVGVLATSTAFYNGQFYDGTFYVPNRDSGLRTSTTGISGWTQHIIYGLDDYTFCARPGLMVRAGFQGRACYSTDDGATWSAYLLATVAGDNLFSSATNGLRIVVGGHADTASGVYRMAYTDNGSAWTAITHPFSGNSGTTGHYGVVGLAYSPTLARWVAGTATTSGTAGQLAWSDDGATWTLSGNTLGDNVQHIRWGGDRFIAVGDGGHMAFSLDGKAWTAITSNFTGSEPVISVCPLI